MDKIQSFDDWNASANPSKPNKIEEKKKKITSVQGENVIKEAETIIDETPATDEVTIKEQLDRLNNILQDVRRLKRKAKHRSADKQELMDLIDQLKDKKKEFKITKRTEKKLSTEKRIKWKDVDGKFKLIRKIDKDSGYDTFIFKSTDKDNKLFQADGHLTKDASEYLKNIFTSVDEFNIIETEVTNAKYDKKRQSVEFKLKKSMVNPNEELISDDNEKETSVTPSASSEDLENTKKEKALDIIVAARKGRKRESFNGFDAWFLIEWANAIENGVPYWVSQDGQSHRTLTAKVLTGNEPEVIAYNKKSISTEPNTFSINSYGGASFTSEQIKKMQQWMFDNGGSPVKQTIEFSGGIDGKIGKGFDKAVKYLIKTGIISDVNDLLTKTMDTNKFKIEHEPYIANADNTHVDTSKYNIPK